MASCAYWTADHIHLKALEFEINQSIKIFGSLKTKGYTASIELVFRSTKVQYLIQRTT